MSNREVRNYTESVHLYLAFARPSQGQKSACIRSVIKGNDNELEIFEARLKIIGGYWRIHKTVNARDVEKARKYLIKRLIDYPERAGCIDTEWRTALLQPGCIYGQKKFMLDVDTENSKILLDIVEKIHINNGEILQMIKSPKGWHYITLPFDTRSVCEIEEVSLLRDGYHFLSEVGKK